eukprot:5786832-Amphidinium_carterae.1
MVLMKIGLVWKGKVGEEDIIASSGLHDIESPRNVHPNNDVAVVRVHAMELVQVNKTMINVSKLASEFGSGVDTQRTLDKSSLEVDRQRKTLENVPGICFSSGVLLRMRVPQGELGRSHGNGRRVGTIQPQQSLSRKIQPHRLQIKPRKIVYRRCICSSGVVEEMPIRSGGNSLLSKWQTQAPLAHALDGKLDGRSLSGLRKAVGRLKDNTTFPIIASKLTTYLKQVETALSISPKLMATKSDTDLEEALLMLTSDGVTFTPASQEALLKRRVAKLMAEKSYLQLIPIISPWGTEEFNAREPKLCALSEGNKMAAFQKVIFQDVLMAVLVTGVEGAPMVSNLCAACLKIFEVVDLVDLPREECYLVQCNAEFVVAVFGHSQ